MPSVSLYIQFETSEKSEHSVCNVSEKGEEKSEHSVCNVSEKGGRKV